NLTARKIFLTPDNRIQLFGFSDAKQLSEPPGDTHPTSAALLSPNSSVSSAAASVASSASTLSSPNSPTASSSPSLTSGPASALSSSVAVSPTGSKIAAFFEAIPTVFSTIVGGNAGSGAVTPTGAATGASSVTASKASVTGAATAISNPT